MRDRSRPLIFAEVRPDIADHLARHHLADLFLDTLPYNAQTTAMDALWAGLPVLTCAGRSFAGRGAVSILYSMDLPELVTADTAAYERLAIELASDPRRLSRLRAKVKANRTTRHFLIPDGYVANLSLPMQRWSTYICAEKVRAAWRGTGKSFHSQGGRVLRR